MGNNRPIKTKDWERFLSAHKCSMTETSIVRENLMTRKGYSPYCAKRKCASGWPRTIYNKTKMQFTCSCGWVTKFETDFIQRYKAKWNIK